MYTLELIWGFNGRPERAVFDTAQHFAGPPRPLQGTPHADIIDRSGQTPPVLRADWISAVRAQRAESAALRRLAEELR